MQYGYFDDEKREYVITTPKTPVKWINYIGTLQFGGFVDHTGGALLCRGDPAKNRITKYVQQMPSSDFKATTLYCRLPDGKGGFRVFSPFFTPTLTPYDTYRCHIGLGYMRVVSEMNGFRFVITIFVPHGQHREIRDIVITNIGDASRAIDCIPVVEYSHPNAIMLFTNADWVPQTMTSRLFTDSKGQKTLLQYPFMHRDTQINYFTANCEFSSFETDRRRFLGDNEYGSWANPLSLRNEALSNFEANRGENIGALMIRLGTLAPGEQKRIITQLGQADSIGAAEQGIQEYRDEKAVDAAFIALKDFWDDYLENFQAATPDTGMNHMLNVHNQRQCLVTKNWSRYLSYYQLGMGARGIGFRDSAQDVLGILHAAPEEGRELIALLLSIQRPDGCAYHSVNPMTMETSIGEAGEYTSEIDYYGDDHLWIIPTVCEYVKETGNYNFLEEIIPYRNAPPDHNDTEDGTVLDHLMRACAFTHRNCGKHGLPLLGYADWNDSVNLSKGAESVFIACLYGLALREMIQLLRYLGKEEQAAIYELWHAAMRDTVQRQAWDGDWFLRYYDADGAALGSHTCKSGKIYCNAQSWPVIAGFASDEQARTALDSLREMCNSPHGIKIATPGYNGFDPSVGGVSTYPPGAKENCGIFLHTNPWVMIAEAMCGRGARAFQYYSQINPAAKNDIIDLYEVEPYAYAQNILSEEHPQFGLGRNSWLSGAASWTFQAATKYILGIRPDHHGLRIDPCIPPEWEGFSSERMFRGARYKIVVKNPEKTGNGLRTVTVNGRRIEGNVIPFVEKDAECIVEVVLGDNAKGIV